MSRHWDEVRRLALSFRDTLDVPRQPIPTASAVIAAALKAAGLKAIAIEPGHVMLVGSQAVLDPEARRIWYDNTLNADMVQLVIAHEIAHHRLHGVRSVCTAEQAALSLRDAAGTSGLAVVEGYGPNERRENEANIFGRELLLPAADVCAAVTTERLTLSAFVDRTKLPQHVLAQHIAYAILVSDLIAEPRKFAQRLHTKPNEPALDSSQYKASIADGPALVLAGPGTGKTRTLVARLTHLLETPVEASSIVALTYSNKAAEEMRERISSVAPDAAVKMWIGTFHAFGLEMLRRFGRRIGVPENPKVLNQVDALLLLERDLNDIGLEYYLNLWEPTRFLRDILSAISRAKDELVSPAKYKALADSMAAKATDDTQREAAAQAQEVARVYARYESRIREIGAVDFGDLIARTVDVFRHDNGVARAEVRAQYRHVLVDEFQDVNRASVALLQELTGTGDRLWAVGDIRQSIYRFRGAAPNNVREFANLFPEARVVSLRRNYRAQPPIVATYTAFVSSMKATDGQKFEPWEINRQTTDGEALICVADDGDVEGDGVAAEIKRLASRSDDPIPYRDQAVLCRSHLALERMARRLEAAGVPVLYLGDLFERPEVRDLLSLLAFACEPDGRSLIRIARFGTYDVPLKDVLKMIQVASDRDMPFPRALQLADDSTIDLSARARTGLRRLGQDIADLCYGTSAWSMLSQYLLDRSDYLATELGDQAASRQQRLAIYQFLQFTLEHLDASRIAAPDNESRDPKRIFLDFVRRLAIYGDERQLRQVPDWAGGLDAVRLMTMHAAKGLEFRAVFLPYLGARNMPSARRPISCKPPVGMIPEAELDTHAEEEECLFFVALSRARDVLCMSRANRYGRQNSKPSKFLEAVMPAAGAPIPPLAHWARQHEVTIADTETPLSAVEEFTERALGVYDDCPRKFFYETVLGLRDRISTSAYVGFHRVVYDVLRWMRNEVVAGRPIDESATNEKFAEAWTKLGPNKHPYAPLYSAAAQALISRARLRISQGLGELIEPKWVVSVPHGRVVVEPEYVELLDDPVGQPKTIRIRRIRTGKPTATEHEKEVYGLYFEAAKTMYPEYEAVIETLYLTTDQVRPVSLDAKKAKSRLNKYDKAIVGARRGSFEASPDDHNCPRCANFFICPKAEDGTTPPALGQEDAAPP